MNTAAEASLSATKRGGEKSECEASMNDARLRVDQLKMESANQLRGHKPKSKSQRLRSW